jgi:hypothetical protein
MLKVLLGCRLLEDATGSDYPTHCIHILTAYIPAGTAPHSDIDARRIKWANHGLEHEAALLFAGTRAFILFLYSYHMQMLYVMSVSWQHCGSVGVV